VEIAEPESAVFRLRTGVLGGLNESLQPEEALGVSVQFGRFDFERELEHAAMRVRACPAPTRGCGVASLRPPLAPPL
jgi:hypothetical protein